MAVLPVSPDFDHLRKQAKDLLREARGGEFGALERVAISLPAARGIEPAALAGRALHLHDAQSVVAREYGFASWVELKKYVEWKRGEREVSREERLKAWLLWIYEGRPRELRLAVRMLEEDAALFEEDLWVALATGNSEWVRKALEAEGGWVHERGGPLGMTPLVAVTHSMLIQQERFQSGLLTCARLLLERGADVNARWTHPEFPDWPLSPLYGAAGKTRHLGMLRLLLEAGADPNDNESLYHSVEADDPAGTVLLLEHGARVAGSNAIGRVLDYDKLELLKVLLKKDGAAALRDQFVMPVHHAILRGRSLEHVRVLMEAGADLRAVDKAGVSLSRYAAVHGREDVLGLLRAKGVDEDLSVEEQFVAACAAGDLSAAQRFVEADDGIFSRLSGKQLEALPELAAIGDLRGVETMLRVGWPREVKTGWGATALNHAVYHGDTAMTALLLREGADWRTQHNFKDNVLGTLAWASQADVEDPAVRDYVGCARALVEAGVPLPAEEYTFSDEVQGYFDSVRLGAAG